MEYYKETNIADKKIAMLAILVYAILLTLLFLFYRISYNESLEKNPTELEMGVLLTMVDVGSQSAPAPKPSPVVKEYKAEEVVEPDIEDAVIKRKIPKIKPKKREVNKAALFGNSKKQTKKTDRMEYADNSSKHASTSKTTINTERDFSLAGRSLVGLLPKPRYTSSCEGRVVIDIQVDKSGKVIKATFHASSSTTNDSSLVAECITVAMLATFNADETANFMVGGTITYNFKIR